MSVIALKTLQFRGKVRRFIDGKVRTEAKTQELLNKRQGECKNVWLANLL